jgi:hypothetical protein
MDELIEQVREALYRADPIRIYDNDGSTVGYRSWEEARDTPFIVPTADDAIAAIRAVRAYDVAVGQSEAEIEAAVVAWLGTDRISPDEISHDDLKRGLRAAAAERARVAEEVG